MTEEDLPIWAKPHFKTLQWASAVAGDIAKVATVISIISVLGSTLLLVVPRGSGSALSD
jgi:hypothetical protein